VPGIESTAVTSLWVPSERRHGADYLPLWCAEGERHLHVAVEGPTLAPPEYEPGTPPRLAHLVFRGDNGWTPEDGFGSSGPANLPYLSSDRYLHSGFYTPPPADVTMLEVGFVDPDERPLFSTMYIRQPTAVPRSGMWQAHRPLPDGLLLLGCGQGQDVFYVFCESPYDPADEPTADLYSVGIAWDYTLRFPDQRPQPRPDTVYLARAGSRNRATRARLLFRVPLAGREPDAFTLSVTSPGTKRLLFELDAYRN
jgi:hypothetical protein